MGEFVFFFIGFMKEKYRLDVRIKLDFILFWKCKDVENIEV